MSDWQSRFVNRLGKRLVELTGDVTPDLLSLEKADIVTTTPEKWDGNLNLDCPLIFPSIREILKKKKTLNIVPTLNNTLVKLLYFDLGISRLWQKRQYVQSVRLVIMDEIHLLGEERGPVLEVIVSRMRHIASQTNRFAFNCFIHSFI